MPSNTEVRSQKPEGRMNPPVSLYEKGGLRGISALSFSLLFILSTVYCLLSPSSALAGELKLQTLIDEALKNNPEIRAYESRVASSKYRIPQVKSLPDPMVMFGYQNEGYEKYTYGEMLMAQWMFSASQMIPFPGKLDLKGEMAIRDSESLTSLYDNVRLKTAARVKELYYDLFFIYKSLDLVKDETALLSRIEEAALSRYSSGISPQQEALMAQTEKYMLLEKEEMLKQRVQSGEAMLNAAIGRDVNSPLGRPETLPSTSYPYGLNELLNMSYENSPLLKSGEKMTAAAHAKVRMAEKEYYPDFTISGSIMKKAGPFEDMWSLTAAVNIPIFYKSKQRQGVLEAKSSLSEAQYEFETGKLMISSAVRDNYSMSKASEKLMELYKKGLIPKTYQDFESALAGYGTGRLEAITVITRLKSVIDYEELYWKQFVEREKSIARLEALTTVMSEKSTTSIQGE